MDIKKLWSAVLRLEGDKIISADEYWEDDGIAPQWRLDKQIGLPIN